VSLSRLYNYHLYLDTHLYDSIAIKFFENFKYYAVEAQRLQPGFPAGR